MTNTMGSNRPTLEELDRILSEKDPKKRLELLFGVLDDKPAQQEPIQGGQYVATGYPANAMANFDFGLPTPYQRPEPTATFTPPDYSVLEHDSKENAENPSIYDSEQAHDDQEPHSKRARVEGSWAGTNIFASNNNITDDSWKCSWCSIRNPNNKTACAACHIPKEGITSSTSSSSDDAEKKQAATSTTSTTSSTGATEALGTGASTATTNITFGALASLVGKEETSKTTPKFTFTAPATASSGQEKSSVPAATGTSAGETTSGWTFLAPVNKDNE